MSEEYKYDEKMATEQGQKGGTKGQRDGAERMKMRINREINDAATPGGKQSAQKKKTLQKAYGHTVTSRLLELIDRRLLQVATHPL